MKEDLILILPSAVKLYHQGGPQPQPRPIPKPIDIDGAAILLNVSAPRLRLFLSASSIILACSFCTFTSISLLPLLLPFMSNSKPSVLREPRFPVPQEVFRMSDQIL